MYSICPSLSSAGLVFGMQQTDVNPPATAAAEPDPTVSSSSSPGSRKCTCTSINPGVTYFPFASTTRSALPKFRPMEAIVPSRIRTSARRSKTCEGSRIEPLVMRSEGMIVWRRLECDREDAKDAKRTRRNSREGVYNAADAVLQNGHVEVHQQSELE